MLASNVRVRFDSGAARRSTCRMRDLANGQSFSVHGSVLEADKLNSNKSNNNIHTTNVVHSIPYKQAKWWLHNIT